MIDQIQHNYKCKLYGNGNEMINHMISKCSNLAQKEYKTRYNWMDKVIHRELCKKLKFDHANRWFMQNPESVLKNEMHKVLWHFEIQTDPLISARQPDLVIVNTKKNKKKKKEPAELWALLYLQTTEF